MRTDARIDKKQVYCKNTYPCSGFGKYKAQVGDLVLTKDGLLARMIARIVYAPPCGETPAIRNWILAIALTGNMLDSTHECWIDPLDVVCVQSIRNQLDVLTYFLSDELTKASVYELRMCSDEGWSTIDAMREHKASARQMTLKQYKAYLAEHERKQAS